MTIELAYATRSGNTKIGEAATTYAAQASCPSDCVFKNAGCYAEGGFVALHATNPLNNNALAAAATALDVAHYEAKVIDGLHHPGRPLRLHTVGDCASDEAARIVAAAAERYMARGGGQVWTYTHAWRVVDRESWGKVSVLASCENPSDVLDARARGYATALVVEEFRSTAKYEDTFVDVLPCPAQTHGGVTCSSCRLCFNDGALLERDYSIGFALHGDGRTMIRAKATLAGDGETPAYMPTRDFIKSWRDQHGGAWPRPVDVQRGCNVNGSSASQMIRRMKAELA